MEVKKEKNVDLVMLRSFLRNIKFDMASNIVKREDINAIKTAYKALFEAGKPLGDTAKELLENENEYVRNLASFCL